MALPLEKTSSSVTVEYSETHHALWMHWDKGADKRDVEHAYREITAYLNTVDEPVCVIVDLRENVFMPMRETVSGALYGPYNHPKLKSWLVLGKNTFANLVASTLNTVTKQDKVVWFQHESELQQHLRDNCPRYND